MPSTAIREFRYLPRERQLEIVFTTGRRYRYLEVPERIHAAMCQAFSKGEFFNNRIRDHFAFIRLEDSRAAS
jgi:lysyl-tRNA synthetase class 2